MQISGSRGFTCLISNFHDSTELLLILIARAFFFIYFKDSKDSFFSLIPSSYCSAW